MDDATLPGGSGSLVMSHLIFETMVKGSGVLYICQTIEHTTIPSQPPIVPKKKMCMVRFQSVALGD